MAFLNPPSLPPEDLVGDAEGSAFVSNHGPELIGVFAEVLRVNGGGSSIKTLRVSGASRSATVGLGTGSSWGGEVLGPWDIVTGEVAEKGIELAERALEVVRDYLARRGITNG